RAVADDVDETAEGQVVVGLHCLRSWRAAGVVGTDPDKAQLRHRAALDILGKVLRPDIDAELIGDSEVKLRIVLYRVVDDVREGRVRSNGVIVVELLLRTGLIGFGVVVEVNPLRLTAARERERQRSGGGTGIDVGRL